MPDLYERHAAVAARLAQYADAGAWSVTADLLGGGTSAVFVRPRGYTYDPLHPAPDTCVALSLDYDHSGDVLAVLYVDWTDPDDIGDGRAYSADLTDVSDIAQWLGVLAHGWLRDPDALSLWHGPDHGPDAAVIPHTLDGIR